jgi:hypothetical protein
MISGMSSRNHQAWIKAEKPGKFIAFPLQRRHCKLQIAKCKLKIEEEERSP